MIRLLAALSLFVLPATAATASSGAAWSAFEKKVAARCQGASGLERPRSAPSVGFDDTLGKVVTLVSGTQRLANGRGAAVKKLCVYDQRSGRVWVSEAGGWSAPVR